MSQQNKFTPAPWSVGRTERTCVFGGPDERLIADCPDEADAQLIAEAPGMLTLLQELVDIEGPQPGHVEWARKVSSVIAKATGAQ